MKENLTTKLTGLLFAVLLIGTGLMQTHLKSELQIYMLLFGFLTLGSFFTKKSFNTSIPFYFLFGIMLYLTFFILTNLFVNMVNPTDGWFIDNNGLVHRTMQMNWIWGILVGFIMSILIPVQYHKKIKRNRVLEISFITLFNLVTAVIYILTEVL